MAEERTGCKAIIRWIWTQVKRPFSYMLDNLPDSQVSVEIDASVPPSASLLFVVPENRGTTDSIPVATSDPSSSSTHQIIPIQNPRSRGCIASSSTATPAQRWKYDVFLSFRGVDTRQGITADIRDRLQSRTIRTFMDDLDLRKGDPISPTLMEAIERSRFAVLVLSPHYADSPWCLEELVGICKCMGNDSNENRIFPIFYHVEPTEVRFQNKGSFEEAFTKHEASGRHQPKTVDKWRAALKQVAGYSSWTTNDFKTHGELIDDVVQTFRKMVAPNAIEFTADFQAYEETLRAMDEVNEALRDEKVTVVGVHGMGGVGKTTMARHVAEQARTNGTFKRWIMATISQNYKVKEIQDILADSLGLELKEKTKVGRANKLHEEFMRRDKLLIILDDVWDEVDLSKIGIPNSKGLQDCGSKMLLTTRRGNVCHAMECQRKIILDRLSNEDSWTLFKRKARRSFDSTFEGVARKVAEECGGLPIALITVARALGDKVLDEWKRAAQQLENSQPANPNDNGKASECIKLSYEYLKNEYKSLFLLCCLFPEDDEIKIDDLFRYAMGKQLFRDVDTLEQARMDAKIWVGHLQDSCLLLGRHGEDIKMHDVVRDTAIQISGFFVKAGRGLKHWPDRISEDCTAISLMNNKIMKLPEDWVCPPNLQILLLSGNCDINEIPETFFQSPNELRVLDLTHIRSISSLLGSFCLLTNLRYLCIDQFCILIHNFCVLGKLLNLEILIIRGVHLEHLSIELGGLTNLKVFDNTNGRIGRISPGVISKWKKIEELYIEKFGDWGSSRVEGEGEEIINASFDEVTSLSKLRVLDASIYNAECLPRHVEISPKWDVFHISVSSDNVQGCAYDMFKYKEVKEPCTRSVELKINSISCLPEWFRDEVMEIADNLGCTVCQGLFDILDGEHRRLQRLKYLYMELCVIIPMQLGDDIPVVVESGGMSEELEDDGHESMESCQELVDDIQEIQQSNMEVSPSYRTWVSEEPVLVNLEEWVIYELDWRLSIGVVQTLAHGSLLNLKVLKLHCLQSCRGIVLLPSTTLQRLPNLEVLHVKWTHSRYLFGNIDETLVSLPLKLNTLESSGNGIISICEGPVPPTMFQNLISLMIYDCSNLEGSLFTHEVAQCLSQLESFSLTFCPLVEKIVEASNNKKTVFPKLKKLRLHQLRVLCYESATFDVECPSLEIFYWSDSCPKFAVSSDDFKSTKQVKVINLYR